LQLCNTIYTLEQKENNRSYLEYADKLNTTGSAVKKLPDQLARSNFKTTSFKQMNYLEGKKKKQTNGKREKRKQTAIK